MRWVFFLLCFVLLVACGATGSKQTAMLYANPLDSPDGVIARSSVTLDPATSWDDGGSLRIDAAQATTVRLFETGDVDAEDGVVIYSARIRTEGVDGKVYLEMWAILPGEGEFFSRALDQPISGSVEWTSQQTPFFLKAGQNPENLKLNVVIEGTGTVWIDDIRVTAAG
ncbi:MAG: hypothetical protein GY723_16860 [bacterium]|nr:hypothetical protein [bacterium]MCP5068987.1 hypothetical protein [bacterium]